MTAATAMTMAVLCVACAGAPRAPAGTGDVSSGRDDGATHLSQLTLQLQDDILAGYERDEPPELESGMIDPKIGTARIGAGPDDIYVAGDLARAPSRWPLDVDRTTRSDARSKRLVIGIATDESAAWMSDEVSWRIELCGRSAVIPLRITALYAHDGDRWVPVFEHLSFGWTPPPPALNPWPGKPIRTDAASNGLRDELSGVLGRALFRMPRDPTALAQDASALVLGPNVADEWHGEQVVDAQLPAGRLEDRRIGFVGRGAARATVAYWIGNYAPASGGQRLRLTHVFERRQAQGADPAWVLVHSHISQPISDDELTRRVFGTALLSLQPLALDCSDGALRAATPAAVPAGRPAASLPATRQSR